MAHEKSEPIEVEGVKIVNRTGKFVPEYTQSDVERLYELAKPKNWQDLVRFIEEKGDSLWHITPGEAVAMKDDFCSLIEHNAPFTDDPAKAYQEAHRFREQNRPKEEPLLQQAKQAAR